ncbi:MAG: hypothetical protein M1832_001310 [Thelocarpon impressellum]|nr:MAG: hypothetical protein M1832_001310 [Thelocarpon impressellum]
MAPQSRGRKKQKKKNKPSVPQSLSAPNLPTFTTFESSSGTSPDVAEEHDALLNSPEDLVDEGEEDEGEEEEEEEEGESDEDDFQPQYSLDDSSSDSGSSDSDATPLAVDPKARQLSHLNSFAPPFYNRPPTPLPPSPSLTSLLRPTFSTTNSRPTTPDSSEGDGGGDTPNDTEAAVAKSARTATTVPRASPKVPTYEYYGFVLYLVSSLAFLMYLLWSYLPSPFLHQLGINYYPNRWWSLAIPSFLVMLIVYIYVALASYNTGYLTLPMGSLECIVDEAAHVATLDAKGRGSRVRRSRGGSGGGRRGTEELDWQSLWNVGTDAVMDVPVGGVCEILYGAGRDAFSDVSEDGGASA